MSKWEEKQVRPVLPLYLAALAWPLASLVFPPYTLVNLALAAACSAAVYAAARHFCPMRVVCTLVPYATGSEDVDALLSGIDQNLEALHKLNDAIPDQQLSRALDRMEKAGRGIAAVVENEPDKARQIDRFARYYLPEVVKLMGAYVELEKTASGARTPRGSSRNCAPMPKRRLPPLKISWTRCTAPKRWNFPQTSRCWTVF